MKARKTFDRIADQASPNFWAALGLAIAFGALLWAGGAL